MEYRRREGFPGTSVAEMLPVQRLWFHSCSGELKSHMPCSVARKEDERKDRMLPRGWIINVIAALTCFLLDHLCGRKPVAMSSGHQAVWWIYHIENWGLQPIARRVSLSVAKSTSPSQHLAYSFMGRSWARTTLLSHLSLLIFGKNKCYLLDWYVSEQNVMQQNISNTNSLFLFATTSPL